MRVTFDWKGNFIYFYRSRYRSQIMKPALALIFWEAAVQLKYTCEWVPAKLTKLNALDNSV